ncbi:hypothetical protein Tco_0514784 [Tanacetum coccineum]
MPYENGDKRGLKFVKAILRPLMLRKTKDTKDKEGRPIIVLPQTDIQVSQSEQLEAKHDFCDASFEKSKIQVDQFVAQGKVLHNYANILELLLRLRQCCNHPFLVMRQDPTSKSLILILLSLLSRKEATKPKGRSLLAFPVRDASLFVITALKMFSGIREDGALSSALWLFACDKERVN